MMINCYYFKETLSHIFIRFSLKSNDSNLVYFLTTDVSEVFMAYIRLSYYVANQITELLYTVKISIFYLQDYTSLSIIIQDYFW